MSEQYYYLLDGKEHGPFSRIAITKLMSGGQINGSLFRSDPTEAWQTASEIGLVSTPKPLPHASTTVLGPEDEAFLAPSRPTGGRPPTSAHIRQDSKKTSHWGLGVLCVAALALSIGSWLLYFRHGNADSTAPLVAQPQAQAAPDGVAEPAQRQGETAIPQGGMTISGEYLIDGSSMMFVPNAESLQRYPALLVNDGALTLENVKSAFSKKGINLGALKPNCRYEGRSTLVVSNSREQTPQCDDVCAAGDCGDSCDPYPVASVVSVAQATPPELAPDSSGTCKGGETVDHEERSGTNPDQNILRFATSHEVLELARRKGSGDWTPSGMQECACDVSGNIIQFDASTRMVLYNDTAGPSVVAYYWEDNRGNPYTHFYRYDGEWREAGADVMPGYTGKHDDYFEATADGVTKWVKGKPAQKYAYRAGSFQLVE